MEGSGDFIRLAAAAAMSAALGLAIAHPEKGRTAAASVSAKVDAMKPVRASLADEACPLGQPPFTNAFAEFDDVLSVSPLGAITAPGEPLPAPYVRVNTKKDASRIKRRITIARAPGRADIVAIERRVQPRVSEDGATGGEVSWRLHLAACKDIRFYYDQLDAIDAGILKAAGGLSAFTEIGGPQHLAIKTQIRVRPGDPVGVADGFTVGLEDLGAKPVTAARPARYTPNPYIHTAIFDVDPEISEVITLTPAQARCPPDYLPEPMRRQWTEKLGDVHGLRRARGADACRVAIRDIPGTAQGAWFTDASHNAATRKVSAIALTPDAIDPSRLVFSLHGRVKSLTPDMIALSPKNSEGREAAAKDFLTFPKGDGRLNAPFSEVAAGPVYCYQKLRATFVGPEITGVVLLQIDNPLIDDALNGKTGGAPLMKIEARGDVSRCIDLPEPWSFTGGETTFYR